ncbi:MAG: hypothetical protein ACRDP7_50395 [Trebonia sp.]
MLIHPWDAATGAAEWQDWLATTDRFRMLAVNNLDPARAPLVLPTHFTDAGACSSVRRIDDLVVRGTLVEPC